MTVEEYLERRFGVKSEAAVEPHLPSVYDRSGRKMPVLEWVSQQARLALEWHQLITEPLVGSSPRHREAFQVVDEAMTLDDARQMQRHLKGNLSPHQYAELDAFLNNGLCRVGEHMRVLCRYGGVDSDTASFEMRRYFSQMRHDVHALLHYWNESAGDVTVSIPEADSHIRQHIDAIEIDEREHMFRLYMETAFPYVAKGNRGPYFDDGRAAHRRRVIVSPTQPLWLSSASMTTAVTA